MDKLKNLMLYIAQQCEDDERFGALKLNKLLFLIDFNAYAAQGKPVTETTYVRRHKGPVPKDLVPARRELINEKKATLERVEVVPGYPQDVLKPLTEPDMSMFNDEERTIIDAIIHGYKPYTGTRLSNASHELLPWKDSLDGEEIPYYMVFAMRGEPVTADDRLWGMQELKRLGLVT